MPYVINDVEMYKAIAVKNLLTIINSPRGNQYGKNNRHYKPEGRGRKNHYRN
jgi:hypothetical protein